MVKTVLITGSSAGIGKLTADFFASRGWNVAAGARNPECLATFANNGSRIVVQLDVKDDRSLRAAVATTLEKFGAIDVLVNNAGYGLFGPIEGSTNGEFEAQFRTNVFGTVAMIRHVLPHMRERKTGVIVNVSSIGGRISAPFAGAYHASKFAIEGLSESLRYELSLYGIRVKLVEPGHYKTGFIRRSLHMLRHDAYNAQFDNYMGWVHKEDEKAPDAAPVAATIFKAATDKSDRLRYPVGAGMILFLTKICPDSIWRSLMAEGMTRKPR